MLFKKKYFHFVLALFVTLILSSPSLADVYGFLDENGYWSFSNSDSNWKKYNDIIKQAAEKFDVEVSLLLAIIKTESNFDYKAISAKGAKGLMQLMPNTASDMNLRNPFMPQENIIAGVQYFSILLDRFNNDKTLALAAYNAGPEAVEAYKGVPPFPETRNFVRKVLLYYRYYNSLD
jgi:soluble lytic murein transglycosylase-like protein